jgi:hypothetical protein
MSLLYTDAGLAQLAGWSCVRCMKVEALGRGVCGAAESA